MTYAKPYLSKFLYWGSSYVKWSGCPTQVTYSLPITLIYRVGHVECEANLEAFKYQTLDELGRTQASSYKVKGFGKKEVCLDDR